MKCLFVFLWEREEKVTFTLSHLGWNYTFPSVFQQLEKQQIELQAAEFGESRHSLQTLSCFISVPLPLGGNYKAASLDQVINSPCSKSGVFYQNISEYSKVIQLSTCLDSGGESEEGRKTGKRAVLSWGGFVRQIRNELFLNIHSTELVQSASNVWVFYLVVLPI